ncbi:MAG: S1 RNA-binding domain-containing protein [Myxococcales bacterium]|nr:S1 RNA-binding domain-containing protein [Myxococcales bacterium]USN51812.1 MAG: S1 RNA-binding domain-containing protein [Myxococcales bacterium]
MNEKKISDNDAPSTTIKATAVDTGRRIDVSGAQTRPRVVRRSPEERNTRSSHKRRNVNEEKNSAHEQELVKEETQEKLAAPQEKIFEPKKEELVTPLYVEPVEFDESGDFAELLAQSDLQANQLQVRLGDKVAGVIVHIGEENSFVSLDAKLEAAISTSELRDKNGHLVYHLGDKISGYVSSVTGGVTISNNIAQSGLDEAMLQEAHAKGVAVEGKVISVNKGGFDIQISGKRAFCPVGQIDNKFVENTASFVGRTLPFLIERIEENGRNIVVSRRALLERQRAEQALNVIKDLEVGKKYDAVITRVADFGAFADIGGLEGLIPRSEISHGRIDRVSDVLSSNDPVQVVVLSFELNKDNPKNSRLSFSLKKTKEDPYTLYWDQIKEGATLEGRVVRLEAFGAFVELFPGIDGLIHISELSQNRVAHPKEVLSIGDPVTVHVISVNDEEKRIGLSLREAVSRKKPGESVEVKVERGQKFSGVVSRIERYGIFVELDNGATALLPQSETALPKNADLSKSFSIGEKIEVAVIDVDQQNRVRVSQIARQKMDERDSYLQFSAKENEKSGGFGTFADLLKKRK